MDLLTMIPVRSLSVAMLGVVVAIAPALGQSPAPTPLLVPSGAPIASPGPVRSDPRCDPFLTADQVEATLGDLTVASVSFFDARPEGPLGHLICTWIPGPGEQEVFLDVDDLAWSGEPFLVRKHAGGAPVPDLGIEAYAVTESGGRYVAWAVQVGDVDRTLILYGYERPLESLTALARRVASGATSGAVAATTIPGGATAAELVGTWLVTGWSEGDLPAKPPVTFAFGADGNVTITADCKPAKGSKKPVKRTTYTVADRELEVAAGSWVGSCRASADRDFLQMLGFVTALATQPGTWTIDGDTLALEGSAPGSLTLARVAAP